MKFTTIHLEGNKIELSNSFLGKETVKVNGEIVSSKYSLTGTEHVFTSNENGTDVEFRLMTGFGFSGVVIDLYRNNVPVIESPKSGCLGFFVIIVGVMILLKVMESIF
jgi:hypothetical protein